MFASAPVGLIATVIPPIMVKKAELLIGVLANVVTGVRSLELLQPAAVWGGAAVSVAQGVDGVELVVSEPPVRRRRRHARGSSHRPSTSRGHQAMRPPRERTGPNPRPVGPLAPWMRTRLRRLSRRKNVDAAVPLRARILLMLVRDPCVSAVADRLDVDRKTVRLWRDRFLKCGLKGLFDRLRSGRKRRISHLTRCELVSIACSRPSAHGIKHRRTWTFDTLHEAFVKKHPDVKISRTSVIRILKSADLRPHRMQGWLHSQDPDFRAKVTHICSLYLNPPPGSVVLCVDEKTGMQALKRKNPTKWAGLGRPGKWEYEYKRLGTRTLFAAFNTQNGHVFAEVSKKRKAKDLLRFMRKLAKHYPKGQIHIIWDNLNIHFDGPSKRWIAFNKRQRGRFHFHYTPLHASWMNQVELFFSRVQRRVLRYASFNSIDEMGTKVVDFIDHWNRHERKPYRWKFRGYPLEGPKQAA